MLKTMQINGDADVRLALVAAARTQAHVQPHVPERLNLFQALGPELKGVLRLKGDGVSAAEVMGLVQTLFETADGDKSGELDLWELGEIIKAFYQLEGTSRSLPTVLVEVEKAMLRYDADKSGRLNFYEFVNMFCDTSSDAFFKFALPTAVKEDVRRLNLINLG